MAKLTTTITLAAALAASGCAMLEPPLPEAAPQVAASWAASDGAAPTAPALAVHDVGWRDFFTDPKLAAILAVALENNRDLRIAALKIERTRAQYRIQQSERWPSVGVSVSGQRSGGSGAEQNRNVYQVGAGISAFELDLFGRLHNLSGRLPASAGAGAGAPGHPVEPGGRDRQHLYPAGGRPRVAAGGRAHAGGPAVVL